jgi:hypothetical protein
VPQGRGRQREGAPGESLPELGRKRTATEPQKGMFRSRERDNASGGKNAGAQPDRDSHLPEGSPEGWREARGPEAQERMASRVVSPRALARP